MAGAKFRCGNCGFEKDVPSQYAGKRVRCPKCQTESRISEVPSQPSASGPVAATIKFNCPICDQKIGVPAKHAGKRVLCPKCKNPATVPVPGGPSAPHPPKSPEQILRVGTQHVDDGELRLQPLGDAEELLRMERDSAATERSAGPTAAARGDTDAYSYDVPSRTPHVSQGKSRRGMTAFIVIGAVYLIAGLLVAGGIAALLAPLPEPEAVDIAPAQKLADRFVGLLAGQRIDEALKLTSEDFRKSLSPKNLAIMTSFAGTGRFEFSEEQHCTLEESGKLGIMLTYKDESSESGASAAGGITRPTAAAEPNADEPVIGEELPQDDNVVVSDEAEPNEATSQGEEALSDESSDEGLGDLGRSMTLVLVKGDNGFLIESVSTSGDKLEDFVSASSELGQDVSSEMLVSTLSMFGGRFVTVVRWITPAVIMVVVTLLVCMWLVYTKAGQPGWAAIVPVYNMWVLADIGDKPGWMGLVVALSGCASLCICSCIPYAGIFIAISVTVMMMLISTGVAKSFERGILFGLGLWLLPFIFYPILAFSD